MEDAVEVVEWEHSPLNFIHQTGVTLTSSNGFDDDTDNDFENSWIKLRTHIEETGSYNFIIPEPETSETKIYSSYNVKQLRSSEGPPKYSIEFGDNQVLTPKLIEYIKKVITNVTYITIEKEGGEIIQPDLDDKLFNCYVSEIKCGSSGGVDYDDGEIQIYCWISYFGTYNFTKNTNYTVKIGVELDKLDSIPELKLPNGIEVPDCIKNKWTDIILLQILDLDYIRVEKQKLDPLSIDTDRDTLYDGFEANSTGYPLNPDADGDGLSDPVELFSTKTNMAYRDTDLDGIRDGVELGLSSSEITAMNGEVSSPGSWFERIANSDSHVPFDYTPINNWDADHNFYPAQPFFTTDPFDKDTDDDGLPDGWLDGWIYQSGIVDSGESLSYQNLLQYEDIYYWRYDQSKWEQSGEVDLMVQIYEGEDLNLDGHCNSYGSISDWSFYSDTFEPQNHIDPITGRLIMNSETNPATEDSDFDGTSVVGDGLPDGYEVWYSHIDPIRRYEYVLNGNQEWVSGEYFYFLNPVCPFDAYNDTDMNRLEYYSEKNPTPTTNWVELDGTTNVAIAQRITLERLGWLDWFGTDEEEDYFGFTPNLYPLTRVEVELDLTQNSDTHITLEIWDDHEPGQSPGTTIKPKQLLYSTSTNGNDDGWYAFDIPSDIITFTNKFDWDSDDKDDMYYMDNQFADKTEDYFIVVRYMQPDATSSNNYNFEWAVSSTSQSDDECWKQSSGSSEWTALSGNQLKYIVSGYDFNSEVGDNLCSLHEFVVATNPKLKNTDEIKLGPDYHNDGLDDGTEVGWDSSDTPLQHPYANLFPGATYPNPEGGVIFRL
jgi:hypothetical protein